MTIVSRRLRRGKYGDPHEIHVHMRNKTILYTITEIYIQIPGIINCTSLTRNRDFKFDLGICGVQKSTAS